MQAWAKVGPGHAGCKIALHTAVFGAVMAAAEINASRVVTVSTIGQALAIDKAKSRSQRMISPGQVALFFLLDCFRLYDRAQCGSRCFAGVEPHAQCRMCITKCHIKLQFQKITSNLVSVNSDPSVLLNAHDTEGHYACMASFLQRVECISSYFLGYLHQLIRSREGSFSVGKNLHMPYAVHFVNSSFKDGSHLQMTAFDEV